MSSPQACGSSREPDSGGGGDDGNKGLSTGLICIIMCVHTCPHTIAAECVRRCVVGRSHRCCVRASCSPLLLVAFAAAAATAVACARPQSAGGGVARVRGWRLLRVHATEDSALCLNSVILIRNPALLSPATRSPPRRRRPHSGSPARSPRSAVRPRRLRSPLRMQSQRCVLLPASHFSSPSELRNEEKWKSRAAAPSVAQNGFRSCSPLVYRLINVCADNDVFHSLAACRIDDQ